MANKKVVSAIMTLSMLLPTAQVFAMKETSDQTVVTKKDKPKRPDKSQRKKLSKKPAQTNAQPTKTEDPNTATSATVTAPQAPATQNNKSSFLGKLFGNLGQCCQMGTEFWKQSNTKTKVGIGAGALVIGATGLWCACKIIPKFIKLGASCLKSYLKIAGTIGTSIATYMGIKKLFGLKDKNKTWIQEVQKDACNLFGKVKNLIGKVVGSFFNIGCTP